MLAHIKHCLITSSICNPLSSQRSRSRSPCYDLEQSVLTEMSGSFPLQSGAESMTPLPHPTSSSLHQWARLCSLFLLPQLTFNSPAMSGSWPLACSLSSGGQRWLGRTVDSCVDWRGGRHFQGRAPFTNHTFLSVQHPHLTSSAQERPLKPGLMPRLFPFVLGSPCGKTLKTKLTHYILNERTD